MGLAASEVVWSCTTGSPAPPPRRRTAPTSICFRLSVRCVRRKKLDWIAVLVGALAQVHLPEIRGELGLLVLPARHVSVRRDNLPPGLQGGGGGALDREAGLLPPFSRACSSKRTRSSSILSRSTSSASEADTAASSRFAVSRTR